MNKSVLKFVTDLGPLVIFFYFYYNNDKNLIVAIPPLIVATIIAVLIMWIVEKTIPKVPLISGILITLFGGLTIYFDDPIFIYMKPTIINILFGLAGTEDKAVKLSSYIAIFGVINVPIIKFSVDWWSTLHQPASINLLKETSIHSSMLLPLGIMTAAFALFSLLIFLMKYNTELIKIKNKGLDRL